MIALPPEEVFHPSEIEELGDLSTEILERVQDRRPVAAIRGGRVIILPSPVAPNPNTNPNANRPNPNKVRGGRENLFVPVSMLTDPDTDDD